MTPNPFSSPTRCPRGPFPRPSFRTARRAERTHICFIEPMEPRLLLAAHGMTPRLNSTTTTAPALTHTTAALSMSRLGLAATSVAGKALFGGGGVFERPFFGGVDIYDAATG